MRDWEKVFAALEKEFDPKYLKDLNEEMDKGNERSGSRKEARPYAPIWLYKKRLNDVLGIVGYRTLVTSPQVYHAAKRNIDILSVDVTLQLMEEDGRTVAFETRKPGVAEITGSGALPLNLGKATSVGLKNCCEDFGIGGNIDLIWKKSHAQSQQSQPLQPFQGVQTQQAQLRAHPMQQVRTQPLQAVQRPAEQVQSKEKEYRVVPRGTMRAGRNGSYYVPVRITDGAEVELWFYKDRYESLLGEPSQYGCANRFDDLRKIWATGSRELKIVAEEGRGKLYFRRLEK